MRLNGTTALMEYSLDGGVTWTTCTAPSTDLLPRRYEILIIYGIRVRVKATGTTPPGTQLYIAVSKNFGASMPLSQDTTALAFFNAAVRDLKLDPNTLYPERYALVNRAIKTIATLFADILSQSYMEEALLVSDTTGRYSTATGTFTYTTLLLTITMNTSFSSSDVGKLVMFRVGSSVYVGTVTAYVSTTSVTVGGANLPTSDQTVDYAMIVSSTPVGDVAPLVGIRMMRTGPQVKCVLESTSTSRVKNISVEEYRTWSTTTFQNRSMVVWAFSGEKLWLSKGSDVSSYGTLVFRYPRIPIEVRNNTDKIDIADGAATELALLKLKQLMAERINIPIKQLIPAFEQQIQVYVVALYRTFGSEISLEISKEKVQALI